MIFFIKPLLEVDNRMLNKHVLNVIVSSYSNHGMYLQIATDN